MFALEVPDMSCRSCASKITKAIKELDPQATVDVDLASKVVRISQAQAQAHELKTALEQAGYTPGEPTQAQVASSTGAGVSGCCGGCK